MYLFRVANTSPDPNDHNDNIVDFVFQERRQQQRQPEQKRLHEEASLGSVLSSAPELAVQRHAEDVDVQVFESLTFRKCHK